MVCIPETFAINWGSFLNPFLPCLSNICLPDRIVGRQDLYNDDSRQRSQKQTKTI